MNPVALITFGSRLGPYLGRVAVQNKNFIPMFVQRLRAGRAVVGDKVSDIIAWVKQNPANAVLAASTLASLGYAVADLFGDSDDAGIQQFQADLVAVAKRAAAKIDGIGALSERAKGDELTEDHKVQDEVDITVLSWARGFFGGVQNAVAAHRYLQVFVEMPLGDVQHKFATLKLR